MHKKAQVTVFIIIGIVLVSLVAGYFLFKDKLFTSQIPASIEPVYTKFLSCLEEEVNVGIDVLGTHAGYIDLPDFETGSSYMPFGSQLNFLGNPIPYWYYVSGNNIEKEQVPTKLEMQKDLADFIEEKVRGCEFDSFYEEGFEISQGAPSAKVTIKGGSVEVDLNMNLEISKNEDSSIIKNHNVIINSELGNLYSSALEVYEKEQGELFLEEYAVDTLRLYAPVDGVELTCSPKVWNPEEVFDELGEAIEANTLALKNKGGDFSLTKKENEYFVLDLGVDEDVRFLNSKTWANGFEVAPAEGSILISKPVGNQAGLGVLGFCYVPYHFVYDVKYPVLVQVSKGDEIFQFPLAVVLENNNPRRTLEVEIEEIEEVNLCEYKNNQVEVNIYDSGLNSVDAEISYECFGSSCDIGRTENGKLIANFPQCVNGYIQTRAEGYVDSKFLFSTTDEGSVDIILDRNYLIDIDLSLDGKVYDDEAIISFAGDKFSKTIVYPETSEVELTEGQYEIEVFIYRNSSIKLEATTHEQCIETAQEGLGGIFGLTEERCFEIEIPSQIISNVLVGGGKQNYYILEDELKSGAIEISSESLPMPKTIEDLQTNYAAFESKDLGVMF
ncbi:MAG: hypothetical protein PVJ67_04690 [Candidatus Pacearchaeota archaeon]|jgi:hypothetical protein